MTDLGKRDVRISIHALLAESDLFTVVDVLPERISIHALLAESDPRDCPASSRRRYFYPRSPCGERRGIDLSEFNRAVFLSTLSLRRATDVSGVQGYRTFISIHALLAESDRLSQTNVHICWLFLSTLSLRRATPVR